jgi:hypothetical protein
MDVESAISLLSQTNWGLLILLLVLLGIASAVLLPTRSPSSVDGRSAEHRHQ